MFGVHHAAAKAKCYAAYTRRSVTLVEGFEPPRNTSLVLSCFRTSW